MNYAEQGRNPTRHIVGIGIVVILHVFLIIGLINGLGSTIIDKLKAPVETKIIQDQNKPPPPPPPPPPPEVPVTAPPPFIPPPEINVQPPPQETHAIVAVQHAAPTPYVPTVKAPVVQAQPDRDVSERPIAGAPLQYPPQMQEEEREGSARVSCDVDTDGATSNCKIDSVSGGSAFGSAALSYVKRARYRPRTHNGQPVASSHQWNIRFTLNGAE
jgi:protein TonB